MKFKSKNEGKFFPFDPTDPKAGGVSLRVCPTETSKQIAKIAKIRDDIQVLKGQRFTVPVYDEKVRDAKLYDYCITGWDGVELDGKALPCNLENKAKMMKVIQFETFVIDNLEELREAAGKFGDQAKN